MLHPCVVGFALHYIHDVFHRKMVLVVFNISVACHNFEMTMRGYSRADAFFSDAFDETNE